jgi:aspartyl-tRNA(Asn)/glutamyl-tRNA(Gln) amidotransferase subunit B
LSLPELPDDKKDRYMQDFGIGEYDADNLVSEKETAIFFEKLIKGRDGKLVANWITSNLFGALNKLSLSIEDSPVSANDLGKLLDLITEGVISGRIAKEIFEVMIKTGDEPSQIVEEKGLQQLTDLSAIEIAVDQVIANNTGQVEQIKNGNTKVVGWIVGQVMKNTRGTASPVLVNQLLKKKLRL